VKIKVGSGVLLSKTTGERRRAGKGQKDGVKKIRALYRSQNVNWDAETVQIAGSAVQNREIRFRPS
jgi:hypothetical protein